MTSQCWAPTCRATSCNPAAVRIPMPVHAGALAYLGLPLLDNLLLEELAASCVARARWDFQLIVAPLALARFTGSPVNPIAVL